MKFLGACGGGFLANHFIQSDCGAPPSQAIADEVFSEFVSENVDKVEMLYTRFVSLISSRPVVQSLLPLSPSGEARDRRSVPARLFILPR